jgi:hypothetical protein
VEIIPVQYVDTVIKRVTKGTHVSKRNEIGADPELAEIMLITAHFVKCNTTGSTGTNDYKLDQVFFNHIPGTKQVLSSKKDSKGWKKLGTDKLTSNTFIAGSVATRHMKFSLDGMFNFVLWTIKVKVGISNEIISTMKGTYKGMVIQKYGSKEQMTLSDVFIMSDLWVNLLSLTRVLKSEQSN